MLNSFEILADLVHYLSLLCGHFQRKYDDLAVHVRCDENGKLT